MSGGALAAASWVAGDRVFDIAAVAFYLLFAGIACAWSGREGDFAAIMRVGGDESQRGLDRNATALAGIAMVIAAIFGTIVQTAGGEDPGGYGVLCVVGGVACVVSLVVLRLRR